MKVKRTIETDQFEVRSDLGKTYTVIEETQQEGRVLNGMTTWQDGVKAYRIVDNGYANRLSETSYLNSRTGETLTRAPTAE